MYYMIDNYDSFVYNLSAYLKEAGQDVLVRRADQVSISEIYALQPKGIILSPGPKRPVDAVESIQILQEFQNRIPILGVCLGHQVIAHTFGARVRKSRRPMHGKVTTVRHDSSGLLDFPQLLMLPAITHWWSQRSICRLVSLSTPGVRTETLWQSPTTPCLFTAYNSIRKPY